MPDATITSTASTFGTISGVFSADQSTISGTISGIVPGTLTGSVGVPGPAGPGVPAGGTAGQYLQKTSGVDYATDWVTVNLTGLATESWVTAGFYPLTGNPSSFLTASALTPYLTSATAASTYQTLSGMSSYLTTSAAASTYQTLSGMSDYLAKAGNLAGLANTGTARTNLGLGSLAVVNDAPSDGSQYARKNGAWDVVTTTPDYITSVSSPLSVTSGNLTIDLSAYAPLASPAFTGNPTAPTATFGDNDTSLATTAFVQSALAGGTAVARDLEVEVRNQSGSTIAAGSIVYISGATGNKPLITLAQANNDANSAQTIGFVKTAIANNGTGYVIVRGELENIDTSALTEGVQLYLSPTVAGSWTTTKPSAPQHLVYVGIVIRSHPTLGTILVAVQNGYELDELHDVAIASKANNDLLAYESSTDLWKNKTYSALGLLTSATAASTYRSLGNNTFGNIEVNSGNAITINDGGIHPNNVFLDNNGIDIRDGITFAQVAAFRLDGVILPSAGLTFSDTTTQTSAGITAATAASTYQTISGMSSYAPKASPALTGNVTITSNSTSAALFIEQAGTGNILTLHDQAADTTFVAIDQNGKINTIPAVAASAGFNVPHGAAPTTPVNGDIWTTTTGLFMRQNGFTKTYANYNDASVFSNPNQTLGNSTAAGTINVGTGATISGATKAVNIGTAGVAGSTTNIAIGSTTGTSTTTLQGITNGVTQSAGDSSLKLATTAFVTTADNLKANLASPALTGTPTAPTATLGTNTTQIATTAFVLANASSGATWGSITGTLSSQTDLQGALDAKLSTATAATTYYPLTGNPSGFLTSAPVTSVAGRTGAITLANTDISGLGTMATATAADYSTTTVANGLYYPLSSNPAGYLTSAPVTSVAGRTGAVTLSNTDISGLGTMATAAAADYALLAGATFTGKVNTVASATGGAGMNLPHGTAPTTPVNGDIWTTTGNIQWRRNGGTQSIPNIGTSNTFSAGAKQTVSHSSTTAGLNVGPVAGDPSSLANGDVWLNSTTNALNARVNGGTHQLNTVKAWVNFNGTGTVAIRASMNVTSITDNGVGDYTVNFTTAMADANYATALGFSFEVNQQHGVGFYGQPNTSAAATYLAGSCRFSFYSGANSAATMDKAFISAIFTR
jgi:hypothetical protein